MRHRERRADKQVYDQWWLSRRGKLIKEDQEDNYE